MKLEHWLADPILDEEVERYESFRGLPGFPEMYWCGWQDDYKVIVFELLGPSLEDLFVFCDYRFSLKTTVMIVDQLLSRLEALHSKGLLRRDVKPQNCLLGTGTNGHIVYVTDFGLSREYATGFDEREELLLRGLILSDQHGMPALEGTRDKVRMVIDAGDPNANNYTSAVPEGRFGISGIHDRVLRVRPASLAGFEGP